jgi:hypothetical protein
LQRRSGIGTDCGCPAQGDLRAALTADKEGKYGWYGRGRAIALDIAAGVRSLHSHKITHRDLKSPNILLDKVPAAWQRSQRHCNFLRLLTARGLSCGSS